MQGTSKSFVRDLLDPARHKALADDEDAFVQSRMRTSEAIVIKHQKPVDLIADFVLRASNRTHDRGFAISKKQSDKSIGLRAEKQQIRPSIRHQPFRFTHRTRK